MVGARVPRIDRRSLWLLVKRRLDSDDEDEDEDANHLLRGYDKRRGSMCAHRIGVKRYTKRFHGIEEKRASSYERSHPFVMTCFSSRGEKTEKVALKSRRLRETDRASERAMRAAMQKGANRRVVLNGAEECIKIETPVT